MIRVRIPIDLGTITTMQASVFALATPMRIRDVLAIAVAQTLGKNSPPDRRARVLATTLEGLRDGSFVLDIDGRLYTDPQAFIVCDNTVALRFFSQSSVRVHPLD